MQETHHMKALLLLHSTCSHSNNGEITQAPLENTFVWHSPSSFFAGAKPRCCCSLKIMVRLLVALWLWMSVAFPLWSEIFVGNRLRYLF